MKTPARLRRRTWPVLVAVGVLGAAAAVMVAWPRHHPAARAGEARVDRATLRSGELVLVLVNDSLEPARVAQVIFNDAFVDFRQSQRVLSPGDAERITVSYPWIRGESYDVELMTSTGATVDYQLEEAEAGTRSVAA